MDPMSYAFERSHEGAEFMEFGLGNMLQQKSSAHEIDNNNNNNNFIGEIFPMEVHEANWLPHDVMRKSSFNMVPEQTTYHKNITSGLKSSSSVVETTTTPIFEPGFPFLQVYDCNNNSSNNNKKIDNNNNKGFVDYKKVKSGQKSKENLDLSSSLLVEAAPAKRARMTNFSSQQPPTCQVEGCFRDLSSSKDYYRRHRLCNEHSKSAKVVVDGIEQRFCQQCSRFHVVSEFDDDKRSCRKSLAGHNERRRKPQYHDTHQGPRFFDITTQTTTTPFFLPELLPVVGNYNQQEIRFDDENQISFSKLEISNKENLHNSNNLLRGENSNPSSLKMDWDFAAAKPLGIKSYTSKDLLQFGVTTTTHEIMDTNGSYCEFLDGGNSMGDQLVFYEGEIMEENFPCGERRETIDLQQLSTNLQRVEEQRNSDLLKLDNSNLFCCFTTG